MWTTIASRVYVALAWSALGILNRGQLGPGRAAHHAIRVRWAMAEDTPEAFEALEDSMQRAGLDQPSINSVKELRDTY